ncbi:MAG: hypothetical protein ABIS67_07815 [Candidatus Eisenbacteria bacterium]
MKNYSLSHLSDQSLVRDLAALVKQDRMTTADLLAHIAEVDARELYLPAAYPSMFAYCVGKLRLSEDAALNRIRASRIAREIPAIFAALAEGRLYLGSILLLKPYLTAQTAEELLQAAACRSKSEVEKLLAERFPRPAMPTRLQVIPPCSQALTSDQLAPGRVGNELELAPGRVEIGREPAPGRVADDLLREPAGNGATRSKMTPLAPELYVLQVTIGQSAHDQLRQAQALLSHQIPSGDIAQVLERALGVLVRQLEKRKFAATSKPRAGGRPSQNPRRIPARVKRAVWQRDRGQCSFVSDTGLRCSSRKFLEFDHLDEVARGGEASVSRIRLLCRAHNQFAAGRTFGPEFMRRKRQAAAEARKEAKAAAAAHEAPASAPPPVLGRADVTPANATTPTLLPVGTLSATDWRAIATQRAREAARSQRGPSDDDDRDVTPWLRRLGVRAADARRAAEYCEHIPDAPLEERVRVALSCLAPQSARFVAPPRADAMARKPLNGA